MRNLGFTHHAIDPLIESEAGPEPLRAPCGAPLTSRARIGVASSCLMQESLHQAACEVPAGTVGWPWASLAVGNGLAHPSNPDGILTYLVVRR